MNTAIGWAGNLVGTPGIAEGLGAGGSALKTANKFLGPLGAALDVASAGMGVANTYEGFSSGDDDAGWNGVGQTVNASVGAATAFTPYGAAVAGYRLGADVLGMGAGAIGGDDAAFSADSVTGGYLRGMIGDESIGGDVADALGGGVLGWTAGTMVNLNPATAAVNGADTITGGVVNTIGNMFDSDDGTRDDYWGDAKSWVGDTASDVGGGIVNAGSSAISAIASW